MKVGTDAVLLGAWAVVEQAKTILDIGTGSGVIAIMMAQRSSEETKIDAVEILIEDAQQASNNVSNCPWPEKITVSNNRIQDFYPGKKYDLIVCNPPFFSNSLLPPNEKRSKARHPNTLSLDELIAATIRLLLPNGKLCIILPFAESETFTTKARSNKLLLHRLTRFFTRSGKLQERSLMQFAFTHQSPREESLFLYEANDEWTEGYHQLTKDFYLER